MTSGKVSVTVTDPESDDDETEKVKAGEKLTVIITEEGIQTIIEEISEYDLPFNALLEIIGNTDLLDTVTDETGWDEDLLRNRLSDSSPDGDVSDPEADEKTDEPRTIPETVVDGLIHHAYYEYDHPEEFSDYMDRIINVCREGDFESIGEICGYNGTNQDEIEYLLEYLETGIDKASDSPDTYRFLYGEYRCVVIPHSYSDSYKYINVWLIPDKGEGYGTSVSNGGEQWSGFSFLTGECENGIFEGTFHRHEVAVYHLNTGDDVRMLDYDGSAKNGLMDGICTLITSDNENIISYAVYENGSRTAQWHQKPDSDEKLNYRPISLDLYFMVGVYQCWYNGSDSGTDMYPF